MRSLRYALCLFSTLPFQDENEFRLIYESCDEEIDHLDLSIPLSSIRRITLSPWMPKALSRSLGPPPLNRWLQQAGYRPFDADKERGVVQPRKDRDAQRKNLQGSETHSEMSQC